MRIGTSTSKRGFRIAMVAACPFPSLRGSQVLIRDLAQALVDHGHTVHVVTYPTGESLVPLHGIHVHRAASSRFLNSARRWANGRGPMGRGPKGRGPNGRGPKGRGPKGHWHKLLLDLCLAFTLYRVVRREGIEVIHAHNYEAPLLSYLVRWLTGVPVVYHSHNALADELAYHVKPRWRRVACFVGRWLDRQIPRRADFSIALTTELERFLRQHGVCERRVTMIPPALPSRARAARCDDVAAPFPGCFVMMYTGNLDAYQDIEVLCHATLRLQRNVAHVRLAIVTHEVDWSAYAGAQLKSLIRAGLARVIVASTFSSVRAAMAGADVLVCPRSSWSGFPIKLLNYMLARRPIVAAVGSGKGVIDGESGLLFRNGDGEELARAVLRLHDDPALGKRLSEKAWAMACQGAGLQPAVQQLEAVYEQLSGPRPPLAEAGMPSGLLAFRGEHISPMRRVGFGGGERA